MSWIVECAAVAMPDPRLGEQVCAFAIVSDAEAATLEAIRAHFASSGMAKPKTPARLVVVQDFPRTATGKIKKFELREQLRRDLA
jgi:non-ribosomal peptide synthetase component E (peptide arylation enzyme)